MYIVQDKPDERFRIATGWSVPLITLKDEYGGVSHIGTDDYCYVLYNGSQSRIFQPVKHWYREAVEALVTHWESL